MTPYEITYRILSSDTDRFRRLRISRLMAYLQEAAIAHTEMLGAGREKTLDKGLLWIISLQQVRIRKMPVYDDTIRLFSLPGERMHSFFPRHYRITDADGEEMIRGSALWLLMDEKERKMINPEDAGIDIPGAKPDWETFLPAIPPLPKEAKEHAFTVPFSFVDLNGHMNHTRYFDLAQDLMTEELRERNVLEIRSEFSGEAKQDDTVMIQTEEKDGLFKMSGTHEKRLFRISIQYE